MARETRMAASDRPLRSQTWFKRIDNSGLEHRTHLKARVACRSCSTAAP
jgi:dihydroxy-acid dehydratase